MLHRRFGAAGAMISEIGFGTWPLGNNGLYEYGPVDEDEAMLAFREYFGAGGNFVDTARAYGERSERLVGEALRRFRAREMVFLATKTTGGETRGNLDAIGTDLETSLSILRTDRVELYQLHQPPEDPELMDEALCRMERLKAEGKIRFIGASVKGPDVTDRTMELCLRYVRSGRIDAIQIVYSLLRQKLRPVMAEAGRHGVAVIARTALESGLLSGAYLPGHRFVPPDQRARYPAGRRDDILSRVGEIRGICEDRLGPGSLPRAALAFALAEPEVSTVIVGARTRAHLAGDLAVSGSGVLPPDLLAALRERYGTLTESMNYFC